MDVNQRQPDPPSGVGAFFGWLFIIGGIGTVIDKKLIGETGVVTNLSSLEAWVLGGAMCLGGLYFVVWHYRIKRRDLSAQKSGGRRPSEI
jgi:hypothetical protein